MISSPGRGWPIPVQVSSDHVRLTQITIVWAAGQQLLHHVENRYKIEIKYAFDLDFAKWYHSASRNTFLYTLPVENYQRLSRNKAFTLYAELFIMSRF